MGFVTDLIKEFPALSVVRERLALAEGKFAALEADNRRLNKANSKLRAEVAELRKRMPSDEFVEHKGVLFKRGRSGAFDGIAYCPVCQLALSTPEEFFPPRCSKCRFDAPFALSQIPQIITEISAG